MSYEVSLGLLEDASRINNQPQVSSSLTFLEPDPKNLKL